MTPALLSRNIPLTETMNEANERTMDAGEKATYVQRIREAKDALKTIRMKLIFLEHKTRSASIAITKVEEAEFWLENELRQMGANPYPNFQDPQVIDD